MLIKARSLRELPILSVLQGKKIAEVKDVIYDPFENRIIALLLYPTGVLSKDKFILYQDVKSIGKDAIIVDSSLVLKKSDEIDRNVLTLKKREKLLLGTRIVTEDGEQLGVVTDYFFEPATGTVKQLELSQGGFADFKSGRKLVNISNIISMGPDATIVSIETADLIEEQSQTQGLQGKLNQTSDTLEQNTDSLKTKLEGVKDKITSYFREPVVAEPKTEPAHLDESPTPYPQNLDDITTSDLNYQNENPMFTEPNYKSQAKVDYEDAVDQLKALSQKTQAKISEIKDTAENKLNELKNNPENQAKYESLSENIRTTRDLAQDKFSEYQTVAYNQISRVKEDRIEQKKKNAVGLFLTKSILDASDNILANRGEIITNKLITQAEDLGILDQVLKNTSYDPIT